jgi:hypothetical protein
MHPSNESEGLEFVSPDDKHIQNVFIVSWHYHLKQLNDPEETFPE